MTSQAKIPTKPKGFNAVTATVSVANVSDAIAYYEDIMKAELVESLTIPNTETVFHAIIKIAGTFVVLSLDENALPYSGPGHVTLHHYLENVEEVFEKATNNGAVVVSPVTATWWGDLTAIVIDPFGVRWSFGQRAEQLNLQDRKERLIALYAAPATEETVAEPAPIVEAAE